MEESEVEGFIRSIGNCISVLQGDLHQPGATAMVLKLAASWQKLQPFLTQLLQNGSVHPQHQDHLPAPQDPQSASGSTEPILGAISEETSSSSMSTDVQPPHVVARGDEEGGVTGEKPGGVEMQVMEPPESNSSGGGGIGNQETATEAIETQSSAQASTVEASQTAQPGEPAGLGEEYQKVDYPVLYYHKTTGYYYDPSTQQFFAPTASYQDPSGQVEGQQQQQQVEGVGGGGVSGTPAVSSTTMQGGYYASVDGVSAQQQQQQQQQQGSGTASQPSIADILAAASDRVVERCGYEYNEGLDMYYDANSGLYYHQESKLYYDADLGCYYQYDYDAKKYTLHSRVALPESIKEKNRRSSSPEFFDPLEEGEIRLPHIPQGSPPPEEDWAPCIRAVVSESEKLPRGTLFVVTQDGASIGREPTAERRQSLIKIPELKISKLHAIIFYDKHEKSFMVKDLGSVNGTFLNKDQRLCEPREPSHPWPLVHGHTLTLGSTTLVLHIHHGWETCNWCDPSSDIFQVPEAKEAKEPEEELGMQRRKELNRIKKKYGLRVKDTYGEQLDQKGYADRSETRRRKVGSDVPESQRPDDAPSSVHRPIDESNIGRKMLKNMGWKGEGLGKTEDGIKEPVKSEMREDRSCLGSKHSTRSLDEAGDSSFQKSLRLQKRYHEVVERDKLKKQRLDYENK